MPNDTDRPPRQPLIPIIATNHSSRTTPATKKAAKNLAVLQQQNQDLQQQLIELEQALQQQQEIAESLMVAASLIVVILDQQGRIVGINPHLEQLSGYELKEVQGQDWISTFLPAHDQARMREFFGKITDGLLPQGSNINPILTKAGQEYEIAWFHTSLRDMEGEPSGLLAVGQDVSERKRAETWLSSLINTTQDAVVSIDRRGRIVLFNSAAERIFGYSAAEVRGQPVNMLMPAPYAHEHDSYIVRYERTGEAHAIGRIRTVAARRQNGEVFPIELSVTEVEIGAEVRYGALIRDISDKVRLQEQLLERERLAAIGLTAATFAHEVGNPLNSLYLAAQRLERRLTQQNNKADQEFLYAPLQIILSEMQRLKLLMDDFRALARRPVLTLRPIPLALLVGDVVALLADEFSSHSINIERIISTQLSHIQADGEKLKQVLVNLCKNSAEAMPQGGTLTVYVQQIETGVEISVKDTGAGLPTSIDILAPFTTTKPHSTGLGLTIVQQIIAAHHGTLNYRSAPGQGTTFTIMLPISQPGTG